eukprot:COSAG02_NODE_49437_length_327_cov_0.364035_1_plen_71_part_10
MAEAMLEAEADKEAAVAATVADALAEANQGLEAQNTARLQADALAVTAEEMMAEHEPRRKEALATYERAMG